MTEVVDVEKQKCWVFCFAYRYRLCCHG